MVGGSSEGLVGAGGGMWRDERVHVLCRGEFWRGSLGVGGGVVRFLFFNL